MSSLSLPPPKSIAGFDTDKPLGDPSLPSSPVQVALTVPAGTINVPDPGKPSVNLGSFALSCCAETSIAVVNSSSDPDPVGYFNLGGGGQPAAKDPSAAPAIEAPVAFDPTAAYVVIMGLSVTGKLAGSFTIGSPAVLGLNGSAALDASACMAFPRTAMAYASLLAAANGFRTAFSIDELLAPAPAAPALLQVLSFGIQGTLGLSLKLTATSLASTLADSVGAVLGQFGPFSFSPAPSASVTVSVGASDGFRVFAQKGAGLTTFSVKKTLSTSLGLDAGAGLSVTIDDADLDALVNSVFEQVSGAAAGSVQSILADAGAAASGLSADDQNALAAIAGKLGLPTGAGVVVQALQAKLAAYRADLAQKLHPLVCAQFTYSWQRLTSQSLAAQFTVPDTVLKKYHADILRLDLGRLMSVGEADGVKFLRVLGQEARDINLGYGFTFELAGYTFLESRDSLKLSFVELDSTAGSGATLRQYSFLGKRAYDASWLDSKWANYVELDASTTVPMASPDAGDFQVRLSVAFSWTNCAFRGIYETVFDHGAVISAFDSDDVAAASQAFVAKGLPLDATGDALVSLAIPDAVLRQLLPLMTGPDYLQSLAPYAMARALPYFEPYAERGHADLRTTTYGQVFADFLATQDPDENTIGSLCRSNLGRMTNLSTGLASSEAGESVGWTAQGVVAMASPGDLQDAVANRASACFALLQARAGDFRTVFPSCVSDLGELASQDYGCKILASMLILAAGANWLGRIPRSVQFTWKDARGPHTIVARQGS